METLTRPFTIGGRTLSQATPASQGKKVVSFRAGVFPSPPATKSAFSPTQSQQPPQQQPQLQQSSSSSYAAPSSSFQSSMTRSTSAPNLLPGPSTSSSSQRQLSQNQTQSQSLQKQQNTPQKPKRQTVAPVPVNSRMAVEARKTVMAKRLRVNLVLLLAWYIVTGSRLYNFAARETIQAYPVTRPIIIWILDRLLPLLLTYNASEAFLRIKYASSSTDLVQSVSEPIPAGQQPVSGPTPSRTLPISPATYKSSPKTRPSTNILPSPSLSRPRPRNNQEQSGTPLPPSAHQGTPPRFFRPDGGNGESPTSALRRALLASRETSPLKADLSSSTSMPAGLASFAGSPKKDAVSPRVQAYWARHEPVASNLHHSINSKADIDRLLASEA